MVLYSGWKLLMPIANKFGSQRHMTAIRKGLIATMPLTIVGSFLQFFKIFQLRHTQN